jgi:hypothetical protein
LESENGEVELFELGLLSENGEVELVLELESENGEINFLSVLVDNENGELVLFLSLVDFKPNGDDDATDGGELLLLLLNIGFETLDCNENNEGFSFVEFN